ncbi:hypothetical protein NKH98_22120, partial [Mesorhizobium sp. M0833]
MKSLVVPSPIFALNTSMELGARILKRFVRRLRRTGKSGNVATIFALSLPIVVGGAGLGVETSYWY